MCGKSAYAWKTMLTGRLAAGTYVTSAPSSRILPLVGSSKPAIIRNVVVLPQPEGPRSEKNSPLPIFRLTWSTAVTSPNCFVTSSRTMWPSASVA